MNLLLDADISKLMLRTINCLETANALSHNETTWEKKQEIITVGLQVLIDCLDTTAEAVDVASVMKLAKDAQSIAERSLTMGR